jgi:hypothetical protein
VSAGREKLFDALEHTLEGERSEESYSVLARAFATSEGMIKKRAFELRTQCAERQLDILRQECAGCDPMPSDEELLEEIKAALRAR